MLGGSGAPRVVGLWSRGGAADSSSAIWSCKETHQRSGLRGAVEYGRRQNTSDSTHAHPTLGWQGRAWRAEIVENHSVDFLDQRALRFSTSTSLCFCAAAENLHASISSWRATHRRRCEGDDFFHGILQPQWWRPFGGSGASVVLATEMAWTAPSGGTRFVWAVGSVLRLAITWLLGWKRWSPPPQVPVDLCCGQSNSPAGRPWEVDGGNNVATGFAQLPEAARPFDTWKLGDRTRRLRSLSPDSPCAREGAPGDHVTSATWNRGGVDGGSSIRFRLVEEFQRWCGCSHVLDRSWDRWDCSTWRHSPGSPCCDAGPARIPCMFGLGALLNQATLCGVRHSEKPWKALSSALPGQQHSIRTLRIWTPGLCHPSHSAFLLLRWTEPLRATTSLWGIVGLWWIHPRRSLWHLVQVEQWTHPTRGETNSGTSVDGGSLQWKSVGATLHLFPQELWDHCLLGLPVFVSIWDGAVSSETAEKRLAPGWKSWWPRGWFLWNRWQSSCATLAGDARDAGMQWWTVPTCLKGGVVQCRFCFILMYIVPANPAKSRKLLSFWIWDTA